MMLFLAAADLWTTVQGKLNEWGGQLVDLVMPKFDGLTPYLQAAVLIGLSLLSVLGIVVIVKKYIKFFVALAVMGAIGFALWYFVFRQPPA